MEGSAAQPTTFASRGELPSVSEDEASEVLQGDFGPAFLAGAEGRVFVTSERLFFCAQIKRSLDETPPDPPGAAPSEESAPSATEAALELRLFFPLVAWTSTERSKKAAKASRWLGRAGFLLAQRASLSAATSEFVPAAAAPCRLSCFTGTSQFPGSDVHFYGRRLCSAGLQSQTGGTRRLLRRSPARGGSGSSAASER